MRVLPHTPLDWVLLAVAAATGAIITLALQDFFIDSRNNPRIRALHDVGVAFAVTHLGGLVLLGSAGPRWAAAGIGMYVAAALLFLSALESARRVQLPRTLVADPMPTALITTALRIRASPVLPRLLAGLDGRTGRRRQYRLDPDRRGDDRPPAIETHLVSRNPRFLA